MALITRADGNDANPGCEDHPFATLERARDAVRSAKPATFWLRTGTYPRNKTFELTARDSGITGGTVAALLAKPLRVVGLGCLDRLAGGFLGFVRGVVITIVVIMVMMAFTPGPPAAVQDSRFAPQLLWASTFIARMAPAELRDA